MSTTKLEEFYQRSHVYALLTGDYDFSPEEIHMLVGLGTNVSFETKAHWRKRTLDYTDRESGARFRRADEGMASK